MGFGAGNAQAVQEHQLRSIVPPAHGASTQPPLDPEHILAGVFIKGPRLIVIANRIAANLNR